MYFRQLIPVLATIGLAPGTFAAALQQVDVVDTRIERQSIAEVDLEQYNGFASVVTRDSFADRLVNITDVINAMPSVQTFSMGGMGGYSSASIRGSTGKQVNVFVDGILLSSPQSGHTNLGILPSAIIEAIEVYPDYTPVQLSDANLAGAINIRTRALESDESGGKAGLGYGSFNTLKAEGSYWGGNEQTRVLLAASRLSSDNDYPVSPDLFPDLTAGSSDTRENAAYRQGDVFAKLKHELGDTLALQAMASYSDSFNELPTPHNKIEPAATLDNDTLRSSIGLESMQDNHNWGLRLYALRSDSLYRDRNRSLALQQQETGLKEQGTGLTAYLESVIGQHMLNTALDLEKTTLDKDNRLAANETIQSSRQKATLAISDTWMPLESLSLLALARGYHVTDKTEPGTANFSASCASLDSDCLESSHNESSLQFGIGHDIHRNWRLKANLGQSLRIPSLAEKYGEYGNYIGEPELETETAYSADTGIVYNGKTISGELSLFGRNIKNGIYIAYDAQGIGHPENISKSRVNGIEFSGNWNITREFSLSASAYGMDSENLSDTRAFAGKKLHGFYHYGYSGSFSWNTDAHSFITAYQADDELYYTALNSVKADKKDSVNISYSFRMSPWTFNAGVDNALDNQYSDFNRMPSLGRFYHTSIHYDF